MDKQVKLAIYKWTIRSVAYLNISRQSLYSVHILNVRWILLADEFTQHTSGRFILSSVTPTDEYRDRRELRLLFPHSKDGLDQTQTNRENSKGYCNYYNDTSFSWFLFKLSIACLISSDNSSFWLNELAIPTIFYQERKFRIHTVSSSRIMTDVTSMVFINFNRRVFTKWTAVSPPMRAIPTLEGPSTTSLQQRQPNKRDSSKWSLSSFSKRVWTIDSSASPISLIFLGNDEWCA